MRKSRYRLLALDVDGTLVVPGAKLPGEVAAHLRRCATAGVLVVIATGKAFRHVRGLCERMAIAAPVVTCNGALTYSANERMLVDSRFIETFQCTELLRYLENKPDVSIALFTEHELVCVEENLASESLARIGEPTSRFSQSLIAVATQERVAKVLATTEDIATLRALYRSCRNHFKRKFSVTLTSAQFLEFMASGVSKGAAIKRIANERHIARNEIACIGDSDNDLSMFAIAGLRIAVATATPPLLAKADQIVPPPAEGGVSQAIKKFILRDSP